MYWDYRNQNEVARTRLPTYMYMANTGTELWRHSLSPRRPPVVSQRPQGPAVTILVHKMGAGQFRKFIFLFCFKHKTIRYLLLKNSPSMLLCSHPISIYIYSDQFLAKCDSYHESPHSFLFNSFCFFFLFTLCVGMPSSHSFWKFLNFPCHRPMILFEIFSMLQDAVKIFLQKKIKIS